MPPAVFNFDVTAAVYLLRPVCVCFFLCLLVCMRMCAFVYLLVCMWLVLCVTVFVNEFVFAALLNATALLNLLHLLHSCIANLF